MNQFNTTYRFLPFEDVTKKANYFKEQLDRMGYYNHQLLTIVNDETNDHDGELMRTIRDQIEQYCNKMESSLNDNYQMMHRLAFVYQTFVDDMRTQPLTVYYRRIVLDERIN